jgi:hypothetical protein
MTKAYQKGKTSPDTNTTSTVGVTKEASMTNTINKTDALPNLTDEKQQFDQSMEMRMLRERAAMLERQMGELTPLSESWQERRRRLAQVNRQLRLEEEQLRRTAENRRSRSYESLLSSLSPESTLH